MSQQDVYDLLKETKKAMTSKEIHKTLTMKGIMVSAGSVTTNLSKLVKGRNPLVLRFDPVRSGNVPKYILWEYASRKQIELRPGWL